MGNSRGTGPATLASPDYLASKNTGGEAPKKAFDGLRLFPVAANGVTRQERPELEAVEADDAAEMEIETLFRRKLAGLRRLPRRERAAALKAARTWRQFALKALQEKRATSRHAHHLLRQSRMPAPS